MPTIVHKVINTNKSLSVAFFSIVWKSIVYYCSQSSYCYFLSKEVTSLLVSLLDNKFIYVYLI